MEGFIRVDQTLINTTRLMVIQHKPEKTDIRQSEHYLAVFDTGQELMLTPDQGKALMEATSLPVGQQSV